MPSNHYARDGSYVTGVPVAPEEGWLVLTIDELVAKGIVNSGVFYFAGGKLAPIRPTRFKTRFSARIGPSLNELFLVGEYGECATVSRNGTMVLEQITIDGETPEERGPLRAGIAWSHGIVVVGMDRQVCFRGENGQWSAMEVGLSPTGEGETPGFEAIAADANGGLVTVGWDGEIWRYDGTRWIQVDSPTNRILTCLCQDGQGEFFAGGRNGLLIRGSGDRWTAIDDSGCADDLWGLGSIGGEIFAASLRRLYRWNGTMLELVDSDDMPSSFATFACGMETLWSIGSKAILVHSAHGWKHIA